MDELTLQWRRAMVGMGVCRTQSWSNKIEKSIMEVWVVLSQPGEPERVSKKQWHWSWALRRTVVCTDGRGWRGMSSRRRARGSQPTRADGVLCKQWLEAWIMGTAVIRGQRWGSYEWNRWIGDMWTLPWIEICSKCNLPRSICGKGIPWSDFSFGMLFLVTGLGWIGGSADKRTRNRQNAVVQE